MASWVVALLNTVLGPEEMRQFGWRLPFLSSLIVAVFGLVSQSQMEGSHEFQSASKRGQIVNNPVKEAMKHHWKRIGLIWLSVVTWCAGIYITFTFLPIYVEKELGVDHAILVSSGMTIWNMLWLLVGGHLADKYGHYVPMKVGTVMLCLCSVPLYYLMTREYVVHQSDSLWPLIAADFVSGMALGLFGGPMQIFMVYAIEDVTVRMSAVGIAYNGMLHAIRWSLFFCKPFG